MKTVITTAMLLSSAFAFATQVNVSVLYTKDAKQYLCNKTVDVEKNHVVTVADCPAMIAEMTLVNERENEAALEFKVFEKHHNELKLHSEPFLVAKWNQLALLRLGSRKADDQVVELLQIEVTAKK